MVFDFYLAYNYDSKPSDLAKPISFRDEPLYASINQMAHALLLRRDTVCCSLLTVKWVKQSAQAIPGTVAILTLDAFAFISYHAPDPRCVIILDL